MRMASTSYSAWLATTAPPYCRAQRRRCAGASRRGRRGSDPLLHRDALRCEVVACRSARRPRGSRPLSISAMCHWQSSPPQGTLLKIAVRITETASSVHIAFAAACPEADLLRSIARSLQPAGPWPLGKCPEQPDPSNLQRLTCKPKTTRKPFGIS